MGIRLTSSSLCFLSLMLWGCQGEQSPPKTTAHGSPRPVIEADSTDSGMVGVIKRKIIDSNRSKPVGKAMDDYKYFLKREWKETKAQNGTIYVDFIGSFDPKELISDLKREGVIARALNIKFVVKPDGSFFVGMITLYDTKKGGQIYPLPVADVSGVMNAIYANTELPRL